MYLIALFSVTHTFVGNGNQKDFYKDSGKTLGQHFMNKLSLIHSGLNSTWAKVKETIREYLVMLHSPRFVDSEEMD